MDMAVNADLQLADNAGAQVASGCLRGPEAWSSIPLARRYRIPYPPVPAERSGDDSDATSTALRAKNTYLLTEATYENPKIKSVP